MTPQIFMIYNVHISLTFQTAIYLL